MKKIITLSLMLGTVLYGFAQKADSTTNTTIRLRGTAAGIEPQPLIVIDGNKQYFRGTGSLSEIDPNAIESINILKDSTALMKYGSEGFGGVIEVKTKGTYIIPKGKGNLKPDSSLMLNGKVSGFFIKPNGSANRSTPLNVDAAAKRFLLLKDNDKKAQPLYVVDGREVSGIEKLDQNTIESVTVIKDANTAKQYSGNTKNGVVIITTKKNATKQK
ncbi:TonB-dependent receptor [Pedobacter frigidisoli]|uniref:TonB-dependent receptor n=1 Tax=Pedobacter frigidisoli TaxID=2530455 RepID=UPI002931F351|nr:TonB-dependent receptor plug domain-containing protein [Pedobacter frigidisoli]